MQSAPQIIDTPLQVCQQCDPQLVFQHLTFNETATARLVCKAWQEQVGLFYQQLINCHFCDSECTNDPGKAFTRFGQKYRETTTNNAIRGRFQYTIIADATTPPQSNPSFTSQICSIGEGKAAVADAYGSVVIYDLTHQHVNQYLEPKTDFKSPCSLFTINEQLFRCTKHRLQCWDCKTGKQLWTKNVDCPSPNAVKETLYKGKTVIQLVDTASEQRSKFSLIKPKDGTEICAFRPLGKNAQYALWSDQGIIDWRYYQHAVKARVCSFGNQSLPSLQTVGGPGSQVELVALNGRPLLMVLNRRPYGAAQLEFYGVNRLEKLILLKSRQLNSRIAAVSIQTEFNRLWIAVSGSCRKNIGGTYRSNYHVKVYTVADFKPQLSIRRRKKFPTNSLVRSFAWQCANYGPVSLIGIQNRLAVHWNLRAKSNRGRRILQHSKNGSPFLKITPLAGKRKASAIIGRGEIHIFDPSPIKRPRLNKVAESNYD